MDVHSQNCAETYVRHSEQWLDKTAASGPCAGHDAAGIGCVGEGDENGASLLLDLLPGLAAVGGDLVYGAVAVRIFDGVAITVGHLGRTVGVEVVTVAVLVVVGGGVVRFGFRLGLGVRVGARRVLLLRAGRASGTAR